VPQVPQYKQQVAAAPVAIPQAREIDVSSGTRALAQGLGQVADVADKMALQDDTTAALKAHATIQQNWSETDTALREQFKGDNVGQYTEGVKKFWADAPAKYGTDLSPRARRMINQELVSTQLRAQREGASYVQAQKKQSLDLAYNASVQASINAASVAPLAKVPDGNGNTITAAEQGVRELQKTVGNYLVGQGVNDPTARQQLLNEQLTKLHTQNLQSISTSGSVTASQDAQDYFGKYKDQINGSLHAEIEDKMKKVGLAATAQTEGARLADEFGYTNTGGALKAIDANKGWSPELKSAIRSEVEHRHAVQQSDADKGNALLLGKINTMVQSGASLASIMKTPEFQNVRDQGDVIKMVKDRQYTDLLRANASDARALQQLQRHEMELHITQSASAFALMDPTVLHNTPREKIENMLPVLGRQWTKELLDRKDSLDKPGALQDAKIDLDDIKSVASDLYNLDAANLKTKEQKTAFLDFKSRAERLIVQAQIAAKQPLTREQKVDLLQKEAARTVKTGGIFGFGQNDTPVIQMTPKQIEDFKLPSGVRDTLLQQMQSLYKVGGNPKYAPTDENLKRFYLEKVSPAANVLPPAKAQ
jgi:hypothetical protein